MTILVLQVGGDVERVGSHRECHRSEPGSEGLGQCGLSFHEAMLCLG